MNNQQLLHQAANFAEYKATHSEDQFIGAMWAGFVVMFRLAEEDIRMSRPSIYRGQLVNCAKFIDQYLRDQQPATALEDPDE